MIIMRVGDENGCDGLRVKSGKECGNVLFVGRPRINDCNLASADGISAGPGKSHRAGIWRNHPADQGGKTDKFAGRAKKGALEGNGLSHDSGERCCRMGKSMEIRRRAMVD
jgi:hypothetical protein